MPRGQPDYNVPDYTFFSVETPNSDLFAERFGFSRLDNRGRILWIDDFRQGLARWNISSDAGGANPIVVYQRPFMLGNNGSIKIDPLVNGGLSMLTNQFILPVSKKLGIEVGLYLLNNYGQVDILLSHNYLVGTSKAAELRFVKQTGEVLVKTTGGNHTIITPGSVSNLVSRWISIKMVADYSTNHLYKVMLGNTEYDLSAFTMNNSVNGLSGSTYIEISSQGIDATYKEEFYLGYVIISGDEP